MQISGNGHHSPPSLASADHGDKRVPEASWPLSFSIDNWSLSTLSEEELTRLEFRVKFEDRENPRCDSRIDPGHGLEPRTPRSRDCAGPDIWCTSYLSLFETLTKVTNQALQFARLSFRAKKPAMKPINCLFRKHRQKL